MTQEGTSEEEAVASATVAREISKADELGHEADENPRCLIASARWLAQEIRAARIARNPTAHSQYLLLIEEADAELEANESSSSLKAD
jgi:hypothetical protein